MKENLNSTVLRFLNSTILHLLILMIVTKANGHVLSKSDELTKSAVNVNDDVASSLYSSEQDSKVTGYRLPSIVRPVGYKLDIVTNLSGRRFEIFKGKVEIDVIVDEDTDRIILHSKELIISRFYIKRFRQNDVLDFVTMHEDLDRDFLIFECGNGGFKAGMYTVIIEYAGSIRQDSTGFFKKSYTDDRAELMWYAVTHFQATHARTAFPCFDEPALKAKFNISITHYKDYSAHANTERISISKPDRNGMVTTTFEETPKMSTYLLAFIVSDFKSISDDEGYMRVLSRPNVTEDANFALQIGKSILEELDSFTGIPYSRYMKKIDHVAIEGSNVSGAMENWGLVTYSEELLLFDEDPTPTDMKKHFSKENIASLIAHELAHQWFGNLVTPKWWKYTWLSEGMAEYFSYYILEKIEPNWKFMKPFVEFSVLNRVLRTDVIGGPALNNDVETPEQIESQFCSIAYKKGAAIIRMMQHFLTEPIFRKGLQNYLAKKKEDSVDSDDLFRLIDEVSRADNSSAKTTRPSNLAKTMDSWVNSAGYPLITVTRNYSDGTVHLKQECFRARQTCKTIWHVPINYATTTDMNFNDTTAQFWLTSSSMTVKVNAKPDE